MALEPCFIPLINTNFGRGRYSPMNYALRVNEIRLQPFNVLRVEDSKDGLALSIPIFKAVVGPLVPLTIAFFVIPGSVKF